MWEDTGAYKQPTYVYNRKLERAFICMELVLMHWQQDKYDFYFRSLIYKRHSLHCHLAASLFVPEFMTLPCVSFWIWDSGLIPGRG